ncbi:LETM1 domain-containing protein 1-like [Tubulanus polymorphus]|uniref:LETM1 domain-containing protein 1-like n=1 Tax=Tubulanus polymorphus TaxID=672921 RepID=UPI003DA2494D
MSRLFWCSTRKFHRLNSPTRLANRLLQFRFYCQNEIDSKTNKTASSPAAAAPSKSSPQTADSTSKKIEIKSKKKQTFKQFAITKYMSYVTWYIEVFLEKRFPTASNMFKVFKIGIKDFFNDFKEFYKVSVGVWSATPLNTFTWRQLDAYRKMPRDMLKVAPVLLISALPFGPYFIFPIAYFFPRFLLSRQFWTADQERDFTLRTLKHRLHHYRAICNALHVNTETIPKPLQDEFWSILEKLESGQHPSTEEILDLKPMFKAEPFSLDEISLTYSRHLSKSMGMPLFRYKLKEDAIVFAQMDKALLREDWSTISDPELEQLCIARGLSPVSLSREERLNYLKQWTTISQKLDDQSLSLLLHLPCFLTLNHPNHVIYIEPKT